MTNPAPSLAHLCQVNNCLFIVGCILLWETCGAQDFRNVVAGELGTSLNEASVDVYRFAKTGESEWSWALSSTAIESRTWYVHTAHLGLSRTRQVLFTRLHWSGQSEWQVVRSQLGMIQKLSEKHQLGLLINLEFSPSEVNWATRWSSDILYQYSSEHWKYALCVFDLLRGTNIQELKSTRLSLTSELRFNYPEQWWSGIRLNSDDLLGTDVSLLGELISTNFNLSFALRSSGAFGIGVYLKRTPLSYRFGLQLGWRLPVQPFLATQGHVQG